MPQSAPEDDPALAVDALPAGVGGFAAGVAGCSDVAELVTVAPPVEPEDPPGAPLVGAAGRSPTRRPECGWRGDGKALPMLDGFADAWLDAVVGVRVFAIVALAQKPKSDAAVIAIAPRE